MRQRAVIAAIAAAWLAITAGACSGSPAQDGGARERQPSRQPSSGGHGVSGTWTIASCQVDVTYISDASTADYYVPDTDANFRQYFMPNQASGTAGIAVVVTFVNNTGGPASLPTGLVVSFTNQSGTLVGGPQSFNSPYGSAVTNGHGSGEVFSSSTRFDTGQTITESPDIRAAPRLPGLSCSVSRH